ncbi:MAG: hypothetical protein KIT02_10180 [Devosia sp.]|uniref:hypothetical protein n=1 Tax=Devosia sp. TaxID=1871048 RepID=UPI0024CC26D4|nr:hypothetical protein [Devosia sp.]UYN98333.1 MAG: hypothetical protein KIT02_10180 [Devosia sp.]
MKRSRFLVVLGAGLVSLALSGCTSLAPVYGDRSGAEAIRFNFASPSNRMEQLVLNRLRVAFPGAAGAADPVLTVRASSASAYTPKSDPFRIRDPKAEAVQATVTIRQGDEILLEATRSAETAYQDATLSLTDQESEIGAEETAARAVAESLRLAILAGYRP